MCMQTNNMSTPRNYQVRGYCQTRYYSSFEHRLHEKVRKGRFFNIFFFFYFLAATQKVACYRFLHVWTESEQKYFYQNLGKKWPATMVNKQLFFDPNNLFSL